MEKSNNRHSKNVNYAIITGIVLIAFCCFGPILLATFGALTLSAFTPYFKYALILAAIVLVVLGWVPYKKIKKK
tara:strand:+ start:411 stop:632 length:222 start_codon:yes stop_codon:yes gene_type:complete